MRPRRRVSARNRQRRGDIPQCVANYKIMQSYKTRRISVSRLPVEKLITCEMDWVSLLLPRQRLSNMSVLRGIYRRLYKIPKMAAMSGGPSTRRRRFGFGACIHPFPSRLVNGPPPGPVHWPGAWFIRLFWDEIGRGWLSEPGSCGDRGSVIHSVVVTILSSFLRRTWPVSPWLKFWYILPALEGLGQLRFRIWKFLLVWFPWLSVALRKHFPNTPIRKRKKDAEPRWLELGAFDG
ncbi:hypothetical protein B0H12DRAFT_1127077 [Mycena haematopus]|nr:hypothetical protein B0H12DRAFT_1127077 [Mycena haematopus]